MSINKIKQKLIQNSVKDTSWLEKAKWSQDNEDWLDVSFSIAVKIASTLSANKKTDTFPKNQTELAEAMGCSAPYVNKLLRGQENLQIETICKVQRILDIKLIEVPKVLVTKMVLYHSTNLLLGSIVANIPATTTKAAYTDALPVTKFEKNIIEEIYESAA